jgi:hypothetical protein
LKCGSFGWGLVVIARGTSRRALCRLLFVAEAQ